MIPVLVRRGREDTVCDNLGLVLAKIMSFCKSTDNCWQLNLHKVYGTCSYRKGHGCDKSVMDRENQIMYCRKKNDCPCKVPFNKETEKSINLEVSQ